MTDYQPADDRYDAMEYRFCGRSGLKLPALSLGLWQNFGTDRPKETQRAILRRAFDRGVTHFDLANNYGPPYGRAEENMGVYLRDDFSGLRDELVIPGLAGSSNPARLTRDDVYQGFAEGNVGMLMADTLLMTQADLAGFAITSLDQEGADRVRIVMPLARPGALTAWLARLERAGILVDALTMTDKGDRTVSVTMTLKARAA